MSEAEFRADLEPRPRGDRGCRAARRLTGYRAPSFSIDARTPWAHPVLAEQGYAYSSSVAPIAPRPLWLARIAALRLAAGRRRRR